jgi:hypothetical protein
MLGIDSFLFRAVLVTVVMVGGTLSAAAQVTIFNIHTADTQPKHTFALEGDFLSKPARFRDAGYRSYGYRGVYGISHKFDVGANFFFTRDSNGSSAEMQFHAKRMLYRSEKRGVAVSIGTLAYFPLRSSIKAGAMFYFNGSKTIEPVHGLRVTSGVYHLTRGGSDAGTRNGAMFGVEQPITRRVSFLADWSTGQNRFGYAAAGLNYAITPRQYFLAGYNFGNSGRGNNALSVFYGYTF